MGIERLIDETIETWATERPDLAFASMSTSLKIGALVREVGDEISARMATLGINVGEFDVLATLRRRGRGAVLTPKEIAAAAMVSPSGLTHRLVRLENMELIVRTGDPADRRSALIRISPKGKRVVDKAIEIVVETEARLFGALLGSEHKALDRILDRLIVHVDSAAAVETSIKATVKASAK